MEIDRMVLAVQANIVPVATVIVIFVVGLVFVQASRKGRGFGGVLLALLGGGAIIFIVSGGGFGKVANGVAGLFGTAGTADNPFKDSSAPTSVPKPTPTAAASASQPVPTPTSAPTTATGIPANTGSHINGELVLGIIGGVVVGIIILCLVMNTRNRYRRTRTEAESKMSVWRHLTKRHDAVLGEVAPYLTYWDLVWQYPTLRNVETTDPAVLRWMTADAAATALRTESLPPQEWVKDYRDAVTELELAWAGALAAVKKANRDGLDPRLTAHVADLQKRVETIRGLLAKAESTDNILEQRSYWEMAQKWIAKLEDDTRIGLVEPDLAAWKKKVASQLEASSALAVPALTVGAATR